MFTGFVIRLRSLRLWKDSAADRRYQKPNLGYVSRHIERGSRQRYSQWPAHEDKPADAEGADKAEKIRPHDCPPDRRATVKFQIIYSKEPTARRSVVFPNLSYGDQRPQNRLEYRARLASVSSRRRCPADRRCGNQKRPHEDYL